MDKTKQEIALALSLKGKPREIAISIGKYLLTTEDCVKNVLPELDKLFERKKHTKCIEFETLKKPRSNVNAQLHSVV